MASRKTKRDLEAEVAKLDARVAEQSAVIAKLLEAPAQPAPAPNLWGPPVYIPTPCLRPHADEYRPNAPVCPTYPGVGGRYYPMVVETIGTTITFGPGPTLPNTLYGKLS